MQPAIVLNLNCSAEGLLDMAFEWYVMGDRCGRTCFCVYVIIVCEVRYWPLHTEGGQDGSRIR